MTSSSGSIKKGDVTGEVALQRAAYPEEMRVKMMAHSSDVEEEPIV